MMIYAWICLCLRFFDIFSGTYWHQFNITNVNQICFFLQMRCEGRGLVKVKSSQIRMNITESRVQYVIVVLRLVFRTSAYLSMFYYFVGVFSPQKSHRYRRYSGAELIIESRSYSQVMKKMNSAIFAVLS